MEEKPKNPIKRVDTTDITDALGIDHKRAEDISLLLNAYIRTHGDTEGTYSLIKAAQDIDKTISLTSGEWLLVMFLCGYHAGSNQTTERIMSEFEKQGIVKRVEIKTIKERKVN